MTKQHAFTREDLLRCSRGELFGPGNAQLPAPNMLMVDRIVHISEVGGKYGKGELVAELVGVLLDRGPDALQRPFADDWREAADDAARLRVVVDQVASLTDASAVAWHERLVSGR